MNLEAEEVFFYIAMWGSEECQSHLSLSKLKRVDQGPLRLLKKIFQLMQKSHTLSKEPSFPGVHVKFCGV